MASARNSEPTRGSSHVGKVAEAGEVEPLEDVPRDPGEGNEEGVFRGRSDVDAAAAAGRRGRRRRGSGMRWFRVVGAREIGALLLCIAGTARAFPLGGGRFGAVEAHWDTFSLEWSGLHLAFIFYSC